MGDQAKEYSQISNISEVDLLRLQQSVTAMQSRMKTADLGNVEFVRQANDLLNRVLKESCQVRLASGNMAGDTIGNNMILQVQEQAFKVKEMLRQSALKVVTTSGSSTGAREKLETATLILSLSIQKITEFMEANGWTENGVFAARSFLRAAGPGRQAREDS